MRPQVAGPDAPSDFGLAREQRFLLAVIAPDSQGQTFPRHPPPDLQWPRVLLLAQVQNMLPLLHQRLKDLRVPLPGTIQARLKVTFRAVAMRNLHMAAALVRLLDLLEGAGIEAVPFKGPLLAVQAYGHLSLRSFLDLDVMVRAGDFDRAAQVLLDAGYLSDGGPVGIEAYNRCFTDPSGTVPIELHHGFAEPRYAFRLDPGPMWDRLEYAVLSGRRVRSFSAEDLLTTLSIHGAKHRWERLLWVRDVAGLLYHRGEDLDWLSLQNENRRRGTLRTLFLSLLLSRRAFGVPLPTDLRAAIEEDRQARELAHDLLRRLIAGLMEKPAEDQSELYAEETLNDYLRMRERRRDRFHYARLLLLHRLRPTERDREALPVPYPLTWLLYVVRPFRLAYRYGWKSLKRYVKSFLRMLREL